MGSRSGNSTTVVKNLPDYAQTYVESYLYRAQTLSLDIPTHYADPTLAAQNANETDAITRLATRGKNGNSTITKGVTHVQGVLDGDYLNGTRAEFLTMKGKVTSDPTATFNNEIKAAMGGNLILMGPAANENHAQDLVVNTPTRYLTRAEARLYARNYRVERIMQNDAMAVGVPYANQELKNAEVLRLAGLYAREYTQASYDDLFKKWFDEEVANVRKLEILGNSIRAMVGTQEASTQPYYRISPVAAAAGGAMAGAATGAMIGAAGGPIGWAGGAAIGAVIGLLSAS